jgi:phage terminase small subunit
MKNHMGRYGPAQSDDAPPNTRRALQTLSPMMRRFVECYVELGGRKGTEAVRLAGYSGDRNVLKAKAWNLLHDPRVIDAIREEADIKLRAGAVLGASVLSEIAEDVFHKDRFKAAKELLDRAGLLVTHQQHVVVEHTTATDQEKIARIVAMSKKLGLDPATLLGQAGVQYIDAEFTEAAPPLALPQPKAEQEIF